MWAGLPRRSGAVRSEAPRRRAVSSVVEHRLYTPAVTGSNPVPPNHLEVQSGKSKVQSKFKVHFALTLHFELRT
jgi:hypothetical protein